MLWPNMNWPGMLLIKSAMVKECANYCAHCEFWSPMGRRRDGRADAVMLNFSDRP